MTHLMTHLLAQQIPAQVQPIAATAPLIAVHLTAVHLTAVHLTAARQMAAHQMAVAATPPLVGAQQLAVWILKMEATHTLPMWITIDL